MTAQQEYRTMVQRAVEPIQPDMDEYVIFDLETTGFNIIDGEETIQFGYIIYKNGKPAEERMRILQLGHNEQVSDFIAELTGVTNERIATEGIDYHEGITELRNALDGRFVICHNISFDIPFLYAELEREGIPLPNPTGYGDTLIELQNNFLFKTFKLEDMKERMGLGEVYGSHDALEDCKVTKYLMDYVLENSHYGAVDYKLVERMKTAFNTHYKRGQDLNTKFFESYYKMYNSYVQGFAGLTDEEIAQRIYEGDSSQGVEGVSELVHAFTHVEPSLNDGKNIVRIGKQLANNYNVSPEAFTLEKVRATGLSKDRQYTYYGGTDKDYADSIFYVANWINQALAHERYNRIPYRSTQSVAISCKFVLKREKGTLNEKREFVLDFLNDANLVREASKVWKEPRDKIILDAYRNGVAPRNQQAGDVNVLEERDVTDLQVDIKKEMDETADVSVEHLIKKQLELHLRDAGEKYRINQKTLAILYKTIYTSFSSRKAKLIKEGRWDKEITISKSEYNTAYGISSRLRKAGYEGEAEYITQEVKEEVRSLQILQSDKPVFLDRENRMKKVVQLYTLTKDEIVKGLTAEDKQAVTKVKEFMVSSKGLRMLAHPNETITEGLVFSLDDVEISVTQLKISYRQLGGLGKEVVLYRGTNIGTMSVEFVDSLPKLEKFLVGLMKRGGYKVEEYAYREVRYFLQNLDKVMDRRRSMEDIDTILRVCKG